MSRIAVVRVLFTCFLVALIAGGQVDAATKSTKKHSKKPDSKKDADSPKKTDDPKKSADQVKSAAEAKPGDGKPGEAAKAKDAKDTVAKDTVAKDTAAKDAPAKDAVATKPAQLKLKKGPFRIEVTLEGVFEAQNQAELLVRPQEWAQLSVLKAVEHGAAVKQGDLVLALDTEKIDRTISELRLELELNQLALNQTKEQLATLEKVAPLDAQLNARSRRIAEEDFKRYQEIDKPLNAKMIEYQLKMAQENLEYVQEEYRQLEKMYKADDLLEETEKIVLRRAKNGVDRAKLSLEFAQANHEEALKLAVPRQDERVKDATQRSLIENEYIKANMPLVMGKHRLELEKLQVVRTLGEDKLKKLLSDREIMNIKAPTDGTVYYGRSVRGKWAAMSVETLRRGTPIVPNDVFMTVVQTRPMLIRANVPESQAQRIHAGLHAVVQPSGFAGLKLAAVVQRVGTIPMGAAGFDSVFTVSAEGLSSAIVPGMNCELKMLAYKNPAALTIPPKAVFTEEFDLAKQYVYLVGKDGKPEKRALTLGERNEKQVEVLQGLAEGDRILLEKPEEK